MIEWIRRFLGSIAGFVARLATPLVTVFRNVWGTLTKIFSLVSDAWDLMVRGARALADSVGDALVDAWHSVRHIVVRVIPRAFRIAVREASQFARRIVNTLERWTKRAVSWVVRTLTRAINAVRAFVSNVRRWAAGWISRIWNLLSRTARFVWDVLAHPERSARRLFSWIWRLLIRFISDHVVAWGRWLLGHMMKAFLWGLDKVEAIFARAI